MFAAGISLALGALISSAYAAPRSKNKEHETISPAATTRSVAKAVPLSISDAKSAPSRESLQRLTGDAHIDLGRVSFSRYGSYMVFSRFPQGLYLRELHNNAGRGELLNNAFRLELLDGEQSLPFSENVLPTSLHLISRLGTVDICMVEPNLIRFRARGVGLRLISDTPENYPLQAGPQEWELHGWSKYRLGAIQGSLRVAASWNGISAAPITADFEPTSPGGVSEGFIGDYVTVWHPVAPVSYEEAASSVQKEYRTWVARIPAVPVSLRAAAEQAAYVEWSSIVHPAGFFHRSAMLMSKDWMTDVWSWDNCFNAMAMLTTDPKFAWDQYMLPFDQQDKDGQLPDRMNDEARSFRHTKPPIQGWTLRWMMEHSDSITISQLRQIYSPLSRLTDWYFKYRDADHDGVPEYNQGDDSGWDNSTVFLAAPPIETPDLAALLVIQMDVLSDVAKRLDKPKAAAIWRQRSDSLLNSMIQTYWRDGQFVALRAFSHEVAPRQSLQLYLPILLGKRLPEPIRAQLVARLMEEGRFLTENGFSTEELSSPHYKPDGYWRGPIWAPTTMMLEEGLKGVGRPDLAQDIRARYCRMVIRSGFAENFDARTGAGSTMPDLDTEDHEHRDPGYTWSASVFLIFALEEGQ